MKKTQINSEKEYREYCFPICDKHHDYNINVAYGVNVTLEVYDHDPLNRGIGIDEDGNIIPFETPENVQLADWVKELKYPIILLEWVEKDHDRMGDYTIICVETVSISEFN
jgi:hypothetical protein